MRTIDLLVIAAYIAGVVLLGVWFSRAQRDVRDYFVGRRSLPWWAISASIVATETSTITFISIPGYAFTTDFTLLQLAFGYILGRLVIAIAFVPSYLRGELLTVYQLLGERFGGATKRLASAIFLITRSLADGLRLFATGLVLAALFRTIPGAADAVAFVAPSVPPDVSLLIVSALVIGGATILYTYLGGMMAVIWTDVVQFVVYMAGAIAALLVLVDAVPGGWNGAMAVAGEAGRLRLLDFTFDITRGYTFWSGLIGGAFLTMATHGTDQLIVQRYLCSPTVAGARAALIASGIIVGIQFALFLLIGALLFVYHESAPAAIQGLVVDGRVQSDRIFPAFIATHLPPGVGGLVVAAVFAAAMSTLSSSLNSSAAAAIADFYMPATGGRRSDLHYLRAARFATAVCGVVQVAVAIGAIWVSTRVIDETLGIASFTNGLILGLFLLGALSRTGQRAALVGVAAGAAFMLVLRIATTVNWQWYVLFGAAATCLGGLIAHHVALRRRPDDSR
ncbi:MAG TPA: sodium:solute symporter [Vicinamibacterales bacterium]|nr:sodium:solute symporter [Vicinamibacterales bacterium]